MPHAGNMEDKVIFLHEVEDMDSEFNLFIKPCSFTNSLYLSPPRVNSLWQRKPFLHSTDIGKSRQVGQVPSTTPSGGTFITPKSPFLKVNT